MEPDPKANEKLKITVIPNEKEVDQIITDHVVFSMVAGAIPLPILDIAAITAVQLDMLKQLAKKYEINFDDEIGKSLVTSIFTASVGANIGRAGASAVKAIPGVGTILGIGSQIVLAGATTFAIGHVFNMHFKGANPLESFNFESMKHMFDEFLKKGQEFAEGLKKKGEATSEEMKEQTALILRSMAEKGILKKEDAEKLEKELRK